MFRLEADPKDKLVMKIREDVQTLPIEINVQSAGVSQEEQIFYTNDDDETEEQYWARKEAIRKNPAIDEPTVTIQTLSTNLVMQHPDIQVRLRKTNQIIIEQSKDAVLQQLKAKLLHEEYSENFLQQDARYRHYSNNLERIVLKDEILTRQYFDETGNVKYHQILLPRLSEHLAPFYKMLKSEEKVLVLKELVQQFEEINKALDKCCDLALRQPIPNMQIALMTDACFGAAGYAVLIEDDPRQKFTSLRKSYAPVAYGSKTFTPAQIKMSIYAKEFLAIYFAFKEFGHIFWGAPKPVIILTDNKAVTRFFQTKIIPPALWNACEYVIQFNFVIAHIPEAQKKLPAICSVWKQTRRTN